MINFDSENLIPLSQVPKYLPPGRQGKRVNQSTVWRWAMRGCKGVFLEWCMIGGTKTTSKEALARFFEQLTLQENPRALKDALPRTVAQRERAIRAAERELSLAGV